MLIFCYQVHIVLGFDGFFEFDDVGVIQSLQNFNFALRGLILHKKICIQNVREVKKIKDSLVECCKFLLRCKQVIHDSIVIGIRRSYYGLSVDLVIS